MSDDIMTALSVPVPGNATAGQRGASPQSRGFRAPSGTAVTIERNDPRGAATLYADGTREYQPGRTVEHAPTPRTSRDGVIQTGRLLSGRVVTGSDISDDALIAIGSGPGAEIKLGHAVRIGLAERLPNGQVVLSEKAKAKLAGRPWSDSQQQGQQQQREAPLPQEATDDETEAAITEIATSLPHTHVMAAVVRLADGHDLKETDARAVGEALGLDTAGGAAKIAAVRAGFERQAHSAVAKAGFEDSQAIFDWAWANDRQAMRAAIVTHATKRSTAGYQKVVQSYAANLAKTDPGAILNAQFGPGVKAWKTGDGRVVLDTPQGEMEWSTAVRRGVIKLS